MRAVREISAVELQRRWPTRPRRTPTAPPAVAIVRAITTDPELLLLDEITSALDPHLVGEVLDLVADLEAGGSTILMSTHEMQFAEHVADRVLFLHRGRIVEEGPPGQVLRDPQHPETQRFPSRLRPR